MEESTALAPQPSESASILQVIARAASDPTVDLEKMQRLLEMQERIVARQAQVAFNADFSQMQTEMPTISKEGEIKVHGESRSKYARFEDINEAIKPVMQKYGFSISFKVQTQDNKIDVTGILMHRMGHREETTMTLGADSSGSKNSVQALGSSISYGKRYVLQAMLNITSKGEDTDGVVFISEEQALTIHTLIQDVKANRDAFLKYLGVSKLENLPAKQYDIAIAALEKKRK